MTSDDYGPDDDGDQPDRVEPERWRAFLGAVAAGLLIVVLIVLVFGP